MNIINDEFFALRAALLPSLLISGSATDNRPFYYIAIHINHAVSLFALGDVRRSRENIREGRPSTVALVYFIQH